MDIRHQIAWYRRSSGKPVKFHHFSIIAEVKNGKFFCDEFLYITPQILAEKFPGLDFPLLQLILQSFHRGDVILFIGRIVGIQKFSGRFDAPFTIDNALITFLHPLKLQSKHLPFLPLLPDLSGFDRQSGSGLLQLGKLMRPVVEDCRSQLIDEIKNRIFLPLFRTAGGGKNRNQ